LLLMRYLLDRRVLFVGGKGGVGKTTCASAVALAASRAGRRVLLVSTDPAHSTSDMFERPFGQDEREVQPGLWGLEVNADREVVRYLEEVKGRIDRLFSPAVVRAALRQIELAASMPGVADVALFDRLSGIILERRDAFDLVIVDTAPTGHTLRLLQMPELMGIWIDALTERRRAALADAADRVMGDAAGGESGGDPILSALEQRGRTLANVRAVLADERIAGFVFVVIAERLAIEETARAIEALDVSGLPIAGLVVNRVLPDGLEGDFYRARLAQERVYRAEIDRRFAHIPRVTVRQFPSDVHGLADLGEVGRAILG
jgi:arsenite-transporting ATPase